MNSNNQIAILPQKDWKAFRIINFTIKGIKASFIYQREIDFDKLSVISEPDPFWKDKINQILLLPIDDLDEFLLSWISTVDEEAEIENKFFIFQQSEDLLMKRYEGLPVCQLNLIAMPSFGDRSFEDLLLLEGHTFTQYSRSYPIHLFGQVPSTEEMIISTYYDISSKDKMESFMNRLSEIHPY